VDRRVGVVRLFSVDRQPAGQAVAAVYLFGIATSTFGCWGEQNEMDFADVK
jgi:hypothetical protein